jgi:hypothetical protein
MQTWSSITWDLKEQTGLLLFQDAKYPFTFMLKTE